MPADNKPQSKEMEGRVPIPDPTILTTQQLLREIATSREVVEIHLNGIRETIETRISAMDKAIVLLQTASEKFPHQIEGAVKQLQSLHEEKFRSIAQQFIERDTRAEQTSRDSKVAVDAALQAAKEAVGEQNKSNALAIAKSEATFTKQIDQSGLLISSLQKSLDDKIDDIKQRLQGIEGQKKGSSDVWGYMGIIIGIGIAAVAAVIAAVAMFPKMHQ